MNAADEDVVWWRVRWMEAVWQAAELQALDKLVAAVYADHARAERVAWVTLDRLQERSGLSRGAASSHLKRLRELGWLVVVESARQHRATRYALVIPAGAEVTGTQASSTPREPLSESSSTPREPLSESSSTSGDASSTPGDASSTPRVPDQSSIKDQHQSSSSPAAVLVARLLGLDEEDEMVLATDDYLSENNVKSAQPWLRRCHERGDLERNLRAYVEGRNSSQDGIWGDQDNEWSRKRPNLQELLGKLHALFADPDEAERALAYEAEAMGRPTTDPYVVQSAITTAQSREAG